MSVFVLFLLFWMASDSSGCLSLLNAGVRVVCPYTLQRQWLNIAPRSSVLGLVLVPLEFSQGPFSCEAENGVLLACRT